MEWNATSELGQQYSQMENEYKKKLPISLLSINWMAFPQLPNESKHTKNISTEIISKRKNQQQYTIPYQFKYKLFLV